MAKRRTKKASPKGLGDTVGLGDLTKSTIEAIASEQTITFGKKVIKTLKNQDDCGCVENQKKLNKIQLNKGKLLNYFMKVIGQPINIPTDEELDYLSEHLPNILPRMEIVNPKVVGPRLIQISDRIYGTTSGINVSNCDPCIGPHIRKLEKVYNQYK